MKGKIINAHEAILQILKHYDFPDAGHYQVNVKIDPSVKVTEDMIGKTFDFTLKVPCMQHCGRPTCSHLKEKICEESLCTPKEIINEIFPLKKCGLSRLIFFIKIKLSNSIGTLNGCRFLLLRYKPIIDKILVY